MTDTSDMPLVHEAFRRGLGQARGQLGFIDDGDTERAAHFTAYVSDLLWLLHAHHDGEDVLLYPLLAQRIPDKAALFARMDEQHQSVESGLEAATQAAAVYGASGASADSAALADSCEALLTQLETHLREEEDDVMPLVSRVVSQEEYGRLSGHALMAYEGDRIWLPFGLATEAFPPPLIDRILSAPTPIGPMWLGGGRDAFAAEMRLIREPDAWANR
jgi:hemerythrin-like domain-containing protein